MESVKSKSGTLLGRLSGYELECLQEVDKLAAQDFYKCLDALKNNDLYNPLEHEARLDLNNGRMQDWKLASADSDAQPRTIFLMWIALVVALQYVGCRIGSKCDFVGGRVFSFQID